MKISVFDIEGKEIEKITLKDELFGIEPHPELLAQYLRVYLANQRQGTSSTKGRGAVSGSGKKPWRQKGTGRARVGSVRSPLWRHGGIVHGPTPKSWNLNFPKKMKRLAILSALSGKLKDEKVKVVDLWEVKKPGTKIMVGALKNLGISGKTLLVLSENNMDVRKSAANLNYLQTTLVDNLNAYELVNSRNVIFLKDALLKIQEKYENK